jgi:tetratricopeptide (TPR) repeat protein
MLTLHPAYRAANTWIMTLIGLDRRAVVAAIFLLFAGIAPVMAQNCAKTTSSDDEITACTRLISSGRATGTTLALYYNNRGIAYASKQDYDHAIDDYDRAIAINSRDAVIYQNRGRSYHQKGYERPALDDYNRALALDPKSTNAYLNRARTYRALHDYDKAIQDTDAAVRLDPKLAAGFFLRALIYGDKGDNERDLADLNQAISLDPSNASYYLERGGVLERKGLFNDAVDEYGRAIVRDPKGVTAYLNRARAYRALRNYDKAIEDLDAAIRVAPRNADAYDQRAAIYGDKNDLDRRLADLNQAITLAPNVAGYYLERGIALERKGLFDNALADYENAVRLGPMNASAFKWRGLARRRKGDLQGALADYDQAIKLDPQFNAAYTERGRLYEVLNNPAAARASYERAALLPPKYESGPPAVDTARARLAALNGTAGVVPSPTPTPVRPTPAPPTPVVIPPSPVVTPTPTPTPVVVVPPQPIPGPQPAISRKLALVLGNSAYQRQPLRNPNNDARAMAKSLRQIGFQVIDGYDLDYAGMRRVISDFAVKASTAQLVLVFYAGHGIGISGHNYLVPIDAKVESSAAANFELFDLDQIIASVDDPARTTIIILDACRNNPFTTQATARATTRGGGLAGYDSVAAGMLIAFATRPGQVAKDGSGDHSPFTAALLKYIATPNLEILDMLRQVRRDVRQETNGEQITWDNESLFGNVYLVDAGSGQAAK